MEHGSPSSPATGAMHSRSPVLPPPGGHWARRRWSPSAGTISPATATLLATYDLLLAESAGAALAGFLAYESQASEVATRDGLRRHYSLDGPAVSFWAHHAAVDAQHGVWAQSALEDISNTPSSLMPFVTQAADAWWAFLDEREALAEAC